MILCLEGRYGTVTFPDEDPTDWGAASGQNVTDFIQYVCKTKC